MPDSDFARINGPRVQRMLDTLAQIAKSARSQRVDVSEVEALLQPVEAKVREMSGAAPGKAAPPQVHPVEAAHHESTLRHVRWDDTARVVASIPEAMLTSVLTQVAHRICDKGPV